VSEIMIDECMNMLLGLLAGKELIIYSFSTLYIAFVVLVICVIS